MTTTSFASFGGNRQQPSSLPVHYVVLGHYNGKKYRPLTPATQIYRTLKTQRIRRTLNLSPIEIQLIKDEATQLLRQQLGRNDCPQVVFCVDVRKAAGAARNYLHQPVLSGDGWIDLDGDRVELLEDINNEFLKKDVDTKRRCAKNPSCRGPLFKTPSKRRVSLGASSNASTLTTAATSVTGMSDDLSGSSGSLRLRLHRFQLQSTSTMAEESEQLCVQWIGEGPSLEDIKRKTQLVTAFKACLQHYRTILPPLTGCRIPEILSMHDNLLVQVTNQLGNSMLDWYERYPSSCLPGEENPWVTPQDLGPTGTSTVAARPPRSPSDTGIETMSFDEDFDDVMKAFLNSSEFEADELMADATQNLRQCSLGRSRSPDKKKRKKRGSKKRVPLEDALPGLDSSSGHMSIGRMSISTFSATTASNSQASGATIQRRGSFQSFPSNGPRGSSVRSS